jgi:pilus assembly protein CpaB
MVNTPDGQDRPVSKIVIERIKVLAVAQDVVSNENKPRVVNAVTLEVTPWQAEKIDLARSVGTLSLVLRNQIDKEPVTTTGITKKQLFGERVVAISPAPTGGKRNSKLVSIVSKESLSTPEDASPVRAIPIDTPARTCVEVVQANTRVLNCF